MTRAMTYDEIAEVFGITRKSAERLVKRKRWMRRKGNDGKARIDVPEEALLAPPVVPSDGLHDGGRDDPQGEPQDRGHDGPHGGAHEGALTLLKHLVERLEAEIADLRPRAAERDAVVSQAEALRVMLETERQRVDEWKAVADRWAIQAERLAVPPPAPAAATARRWWWRRTG